MKSVPSVFILILFLCISACSAPFTNPDNSSTYTDTQDSLPTETLPPTPTQLSLPSSALTKPSKSSWSIIFEHEFNENYWKLGPNQYQIIANCPNTDFLGDLEGRLIEFTVDKKAYFFPDETVELLYFNLSVRWDGYSLLSSIRPEQKTRIRFGYKDLNLEQAEYATKECQVHAVINGELDIQLLPLEPTTEYWVGGYYP